jgi:prepilin-type N-terminal cleavage/methylation domain-containing protein
VRDPFRGERGFTLIEVMVACVLLTFGLVAVAGVFPQGLAMGLYGKDQTRSAGLAQQEIECLKNQVVLLGAGKALNNVGGGGYVFVGDYGSTRSTTPTVCNPSSTAAVTTYFDQNGNPTTSSAAYFTRDVQVQYWSWNGTGYVLPASPYSQPSGPYIYRVSVATHWLVHGQTIYTSGQTSPSPNGCVNGGSAVPTGHGCVQVSTIVSP